MCLLTIQFVEMKCWKCGAINHIFFVVPFDTNNDLYYRLQDEMWSDNKPSFNPVIVDKIKEYLSVRNDSNIVMSSIKKRYSYTTNSYYNSFGCTKCDAIFGDWYVHEARIDSIYGDNVVFEFEIEIEEGLL